VVPSGYALLGGFAVGARGFIAMTTWHRMRNVSVCLYSLYAWFSAAVSTVPQQSATMSHLLIKVTKETTVQQIICFI